MIFDKVREIIATQLDIDAETLTAETNIAEDLSADSLDIVEMMMAIEDEFNIEIPDEDIEGLKILGTLVEYIQNKTE